MSVVSKFYGEITGFLEVSLTFYLYNFFLCDFDIRGSTDFIISLFEFDHDRELILFVTLLDGDFGSFC